MQFPFDRFELPNVGRSTVNCKAKNKKTIALELDYSLELNLGLVMNLNLNFENFPKSRDDEERFHDHHPIALHCH